MVQHRNCPDPITGLSPAQVVFGRVLRDHLHLQPGHFAVRSEWRLSAELRERALAQRHLAKHDQLSTGTKQLSPLKTGDTVMVQDMSGQKPGKWTKTGQVIEVEDFDSYLVKINGSNNVTKRNRRYLRKIIPYIERVTGPVAPKISPPAHPVRAPSPSVPRPEVHTMPPLTQSPNTPENNHAGPSKWSKLPPHLREQWFVAPSPKTIPHMHSATSSNKPPPPPGTHHDYNAMDSNADNLRTQVKASLADRPRSPHSPSTLPTW